MGERRLNMQKLHKITGLSTSTIFKLYHDHSVNISFNTMAKLCSALDCTVGQLFEYVSDEES